MNKKRLIIITFVILIFTASFVLADDLYSQTCFIRGEVKDISFQEKYYNYDINYNCLALPCLPNNRLVPSQYILTLYVQEVSGEESFCKENYNLGENKISVFVNSIRSGEDISEGDIISGNVTSFEGKNFFVGNEYELGNTNKSNSESLDENSGILDNLTNFFRDLF